MRLKTINAILLSLIITISFPAKSFACSTFMLKNDASLILGHNLDERADIPGYIFINMRGEKKTNFNQWNYLWKFKTPKIQWISKYGSITFNTTKKDFADGGINEAGLYIWEMTLMETEYPEDILKPHLTVEQWIQYQLDNYQNVAEVIQHLSELVPYTNAWHFFIADRQGNCAVIEFIKGKPVVHTNQLMPITVLCNSQYDSELQSLRQYTGFGGWQDPFVPLTTNYDDKRFVQAATMIRDYVPDGTKPVVDYGFDILKQMERGNNRWQVVIDIQKSIVYFNTSLNRKIKYFSYKDFDFTTNSKVKVVDINSNMSGDITQKFINYSLNMNIALRDRFMDAVLKIYPNQYSLTTIILLAVLILIFTSPLVVWLILLIKKDKSAKGEALAESTRQNRIQSHAARIIAILNSILNFILIYLLVKCGGFISKFGLSICGNVIIPDLILIIVLTIGEIILLINLWKDKMWSLLRRLHYTLLILTAVFMLMILYMTI